MKKDAPEPTPPPPGPTREVGLHRCPFCHEAVAVADGWVGCASCLARHHAACWDEGKACAACKHPRRLVPEGAPGGRGLIAPLNVGRVVIGVAGLGLLVTVVMAAVDVLFGEREIKPPGPRTIQEAKADLQRAEADRWRAEQAGAKAREEADAARTAAKRAEQERDEARRREEAARKGGPAAVAQAYSLELVVHGMPAGMAVIYALSPSGGHDGSRTRVTGSLVGGRALVAGYSTAGPVMLDLEWDHSGTHYRRVWMLEVTSDRLELVVPSAADDAMVFGHVAPGLASVMAFGSMLSARCDVAGDGTFVLTGLPPDRYALVGYGLGHSPHSGAGGVVVELGPKARVTLEAEVPRGK